MYLTDLTFIEEGHPDNTPSGLINFNKRRQISSVIREIQQYQNDAYSLKPLPQIRALLDSPKCFDDNTEYELSLYLEPRQGSTRTMNRPHELGPGPNSVPELPSLPPYSSFSDDTLGMSHCPAITTNSSPAPNSDP